MPRHMSLCTGYGGIDLALDAVFGARTVAVADIDPGACKILAHRYPNVPNLGDITTTDWSQWVGKVELVSGGTPCQDLSHAGRRAGMTEGTRSNLWVAMREAIATIRPALVVWENVRGAYSACADSAVDSELGRCPRCMGDDDARHAPNLRALARVLGDLSSLGYDACWYGLRASDVGAAHHRYRVFVFAWPADTARDTWRLINRDGRVAHPDTDGAGLREHLWGVAGPAQLPTTELGSSTPDRVMPTPTATPYGNNQSLGPNATVRPSLDSLATLLPSPRTSDTNGAGAHGDGGPDLRTAVTFLPTTRASDGPDATSHARSWSATDRSLHTVVHTGELDQDWREYEPAIRRQEAAFGRPAPLPTEPGKTGKPRLSARFSEWLMGCPDGWITDAPGITRNEALKAAGNGVVPQQCAAAAKQFVQDLAALEGNVA